MQRADPGVTYPAPLPNVLHCGFLNLLAGASGVGKTALIAGLLRRLRDGAPIFGRGTATPPAIGYVVADRPWEDSQLWFAAAGYPDIPHYSIIDDRGLATVQLRARSKGPELLAGCLERLDLPPGSLIVVDPIALFLGGDLLNYYAVALACIDLHRLLLDHRYCMIGICHTAKLKADKGDRYLRPQDRILGSGALLGYTGTQMYFMSPEESGDPDGLFTFMWNPHHAPQETFRLARDPGTGLFLLDGAQGAPAGPVDSPAPLSTTLQTLLASIPHPPSDVAMASLIEQHSDLSPGRTTVWRWLKQLEAAGYVECTARRTWTRTVGAPVPPDPETLSDDEDDGGESPA